MANPHGNPQNLRPPWKKGESGNPAGSKPSRVKDSLAVCFKTKKEVREFYALTDAEVNAWERTALTLTTEQLKALVKWAACPAYPKGLAIAILSDMKDGRTTTLDKLRSRQFGEVVQRTEVSGSIMQGVVNITIEEAIKQAAAAEAIPLVEEQKAIEQG